MMSGGFRVSDHAIETALAAAQNAVESFTRAVIAAVLPFLVAEIRTATLMEAADEVHREARWQTETQLRGLPWFPAERLCLIEEVLRDRARGCRGMSGQPEPDELEQLMAEVERTRPGVRDASEDITVVHAVLDALVARRRELGLTQKAVAKRMGVKQPTVSQIETEMSDPRISTLQRYARALGARVAVTVRTTDREGNADV